MKDCPDLNLLASFAEGTLKGEQRLQMITHINECEHCETLYTEFMAYQSGKPKTRPWYRAPSSAILAIAAMILLALWLDKSGEGSKPWQEPQWWLEHYGTASTGHETRAKHVFKRLAASVPGQEESELYTIGSTRTPLVLTLNKGVVISQDALAMCFKDVTQELGDARLALVLGHELHHLHANQHHHAFAAFRDLKDLDFDQPEDAGREIQADQWGLVYAAQAGFEPRLILEDSNNFLKQWTSRSGVGHHPDADQRARTLKDQLQQVANQYDDFHFGVRFLQMGRYTMATQSLSRFQESYNGREVLNNLGLAALGKAQQALANCDLDQLTRFKLPIIIDNRSILEGVRRRGNTINSPCYDLPEFQTTIGSAIDYFQAALGQDPVYEPAQINLLSAFLLKGDAASALTMVEDIKPSEPSKTLKALAIYLFSNGAEDRAEALAILAEMPNFPDALYNQASILAENQESADTSFENFLKLQSRGPHAQRAYEYLGQDIPETDTASFHTLSVPIGPITKDIRDRLKSMNHRVLAVGDNRLDIYQEGQLTILTDETQVILVEKRLFRDNKLERMHPKWRNGSRMSTTAGDLILGDGWMLEVEGDMVQRTIRFLTSK